jgi:hypothetical protein
VRESISLEARERGGVIILRRMSRSDFIQIQIEWSSSCIIAGFNISGVMSIQLTKLSAKI